MTDTLVPDLEVVAEIDAGTLVGLFAQVFDLPSVTAEDDFFRLGGDSLTGTLLLNAIEKRFSLTLSLSVLLEAPTPITLAKIIAERSASRISSCLIAINENGDPPAIFCVHGTGGESVAPLRLSTAIGSRPFYAFRALGLEEGEEILMSAEAIASGYISSMERLRPAGRHVILGHCAGASIAYEMAQQLAASGKPPSGLILVDPETGPNFAPFLYKSGLTLRLLQASWAKRAAALRAQIDSRERLTGDLRRDYVFKSLQHAAASYTPAPFDGPTLLICTPHRKDDLLNNQRGYQTLLRDLTVVELSVPHEKMFAEGLAEVIDAVEPFIDRVSAMTGARLQSA